MIRWIGVWLAMVALACGEGPVEEPETDAGSADAGRDGGRPDAGPLDAGDPPDLGTDAFDPPVDAGSPMIDFVGRALVVPEGRPASTASVGVLGGAGPVWDRVVWADPRQSLLVQMEGCPDACRSVPLLDDPEVAPVRFSETDLEGDGARELLVADIGILWPSEDTSGQILALDLDGDAAPRVLRSGLPRPVCVNPADLDGDDDLDLVVCAFGHILGGRLFWMEQDVDGGYVDHDIHTRPGTIEAIPVDVDDDGDLDIVSVVSQLDEMVLLHRNDGSGGFTEEVLLDRPESYYGMSGLSVADLDGDTDPDLIVTNGDSLDYDLPVGVNPEEHYGIAWLENDGAGGFTYQEITRLWGAYKASAGDVDLDGDLDLVVATHQPTNLRPELPARPMVWLENTASGFVMHTIAMAPEQLMTLALVDVDDDGDLDVLTGSMRIEGAEYGESLYVLTNSYF